MITSSSRVAQYALSYPFGTDYAIPFKFWSSAQIHAVLSFDDGTADLALVLSTDFTLSAPGDTGTLIKVSDWDHDAVRLTIYRELDLEQETDYRNGEAVDLDILERDFDYATARDQQIAETISRGVTVPITDEAASNELPGAGERANKFLAFDADGVPIPADSVTGVPVTAFMETLLDDADASEGLSTLGVSSFAKTVLDDVDSKEARSTLQVLTKQVVSSDITLSPVTRYHLTGRRIVTLPGSPNTGDMIEITTDGPARIIQPDSDTVVTMRRSLFTTKGVNGYVELVPGDKAILTYKGSGFAFNTHVKIADPATLPTGAAEGIEWSPDGRYLAVAHATTPWVTIYDFATGSFVKISDPGTLPGSDAFCVAWSPDGRYLAVGHTTTPFVTIYDWQSGSPVKIANPGTLPTGLVEGVGWSPDSRFLACAHTTTPFVTIYDFATGAPVKITNPATLPANNAYGAAWSPSGRLLAIAHSSTPYMTVYDMLGIGIGLAAAKVADPTTPPPNATRDVSFSPDGKRLYLTCGATPYVSLYGVSEDPPNVQRILSTLTGLTPDYTFHACESPSAMHLAVGSAVTAPYFVCAKRSRGTLVKLSDPATLPAGSIRRIAWSPDGRYCAGACGTTPYLYVYDYWTSAAKEWDIDIVERGDEARGYRAMLAARFF